MTDITPTPKAISSTINTEKKELVIVFANGKEIKIKVDGLDMDVAIMATLHGLKQKLVDAAAISRDPSTGKSATIDSKYNAVYEVYQRLLNGEWNKTREGGSGSGGGLLFQALVRLYSATKTPEELKEFLTGKTKAEQAALRSNPKVATIIDEIRAERTSDINTDDLLEELDN